MPVMMQPTLSGASHLESRGAAAMVVFGRLKPGVSIAEASAQIGVMRRKLEADNPLPNATSQRAEVLPLWRSPFGAQTYMMPVVVLLGAMGTLRADHRLRQRRQPRAGPRRGTRGANWPFASRSAPDAAAFFGCSLSRTWCSRCRARFWASSCPPSRCR